VEHAASLRLIPNLEVWRPADTAETAGGLAGGAGTRPTAQPRCCCRARTCRYAPRRPRSARHRARRLRAGRAAEVGLKKKAQAVIIATGSEVRAGAARAGR
jgi:transketolase